MGTTLDRGSTFTTYQINWLLIFPLLIVVKITMIVMNLKAGAFLGWVVGKITLDFSATGSFPL